MRRVGIGLGLVVATASWFVATPVHAASTGGVALAPPAEPDDADLGGDAAGEPPIDDVGVAPEPDDAAVAEPDAGTDDAPAEAPARARSVWASPPEPEHDAPVVAEPAPVPKGAVDDADLDDGPIGGYLHPTETKELPPPDGERKLIAAYILLPLGTLATVTGALSLWVTQPDHCAERLAKIGSGIDPDNCRGLYILNAVRTTYGSLMIASGAVLLGVGLSERKRHREWKARHHSRLAPTFLPRGAGVSWSLRF